MKKFTYSLVAFAFILTFQSCKEPKKNYTVPTTYNFSNVDYSGQIIRLSMIDALVDAVKAGNTSGTVLNATILKNMYSNSGNPFGIAALDTSGKQLKNKTFLADQATVETWIDNAATASASGGTGSNGTSGIVTNGTKSYLVDANGFDFKEGVEKHLQGALIYYQLTAVYLSEDQVGAQVALADRQHHWDESFGYFGVPINYPSNTTGLFHLGEYANDRNALLGNATVVMNDFLKGRAAIDNDDNETVNEQIAIIRDNVERGLAGTAVHYINEALANIGDNAVRSHTLSEGYFLVKSLKYNPTKKVTDAQIATLLGYFGTNFWTTSTSDLQAAKNLLSSIYGFDAVKDQL